MKRLPEIYSRIADEVRIEGVIDVNRYSLWCDSSQRNGPGRDRFPMDCRQISQSEISEIARRSRVLLGDVLVDTGHELIGISAGYGCRR